MADLCGKALTRLLAESHVLAPSDVPVLVNRLAPEIGATSIVLYVVDLGQHVLVPLTGDGVPMRPVVDIDGTLAGSCFTEIAVVESGRGQPRLWVPLVDGTERLGVLEVEADEITRDLRDCVSTFAALVAELVVSRQAYGDYLHRARRLRPASVSTELQWHNLPPSTFATQEVVISGIVEPAYDLGGDAFDYAFNGDTCHLAVFDAMGHGLQAGILAVVATAAYRNARRCGLDLEDSYRSLDKHLSQAFGAENFVTGVLAELDVHSGDLRWVNAGHQPPYLLRRGSDVRVLESESSLPLGQARGKPVVASAQLQAGDRVLLVTDGIVEARDADGEFFGADRLVGLIRSELAADVPVPEALRRLMHKVLQHQDGVLQDDATTLFLEWYGDAQDDLLY